MTVADDLRAARANPPADDRLWCVNITGPDDVIAVKSREEAIRASKRFNDWWIDRIVSRGLHPFEPTMWAVPITWPYDAESHAADLAKNGDEYDWLLAASESSP